MHLAASLSDSTLDAQSSGLERVPCSRVFTTEPTWSICPTLSIGPYSGCSKWLGSGTSFYRACVQVKYVWRGITGMLQEECTRPEHPENDPGAELFISYHHDYVLPSCVPWGEKRILSPRLMASSQNYGATISKTLIKGQGPYDSVGNMQGPPLHT